MRFLLPLALSIAACSSDPTDQHPPPPQDAQPFDLAPDAADSGADRPAIDAGDDRPAPIDSGGAEVFFGELPPISEDVRDAGGDVGGDAAADVVCNADAGLFACGGECRNLIRDSMNCGRCGEVCVGAATCMSAQCIDPQTDPRNCGGLGQQCRVPNGTAGCAAGVCTVGSCTSPFADCDGNVANGCEADTLHSTAHCGGCGRPCGSGQSCEGGACR